MILKFLLKRQRCCKTEESSPSGQLLRQLGQEPPELGSCLQGRGTRKEVGAWGSGRNTEPSTPLQCWSWGQFDCCFTPETGYAFVINHFSSVLASCDLVSKQTALLCNLSPLQAGAETFVKKINLEVGNLPYVCLISPCVSFSQF